jgi:hypothetical protein
VSRRHYSDWIQTYLDLERGRSEAPETFNFWSAIATIGAAITRHVCIEEIKYKVFPNWIIVLAAIPGRAKKSTTVDRCTDLLRYNHPELFGADETNWPDICRTLAENVSYISENETDLDTEYGTQCAITFVPSELGTFLNPDDGHAIDGITRLWDCPNRPFLKSTKHSGIDNIVNPFFNLIGCTTTKWLKDNFSKYEGWGIASRIVFVHSDAPTRPIWSPSREIQPKNWETTRAKLSEDLEHIMKLQGTCNFTDEAAGLAKRWYDKTFVYLEEYDKKYDKDPWLADFLARKQIHAHKLAMTLSISRRDSLTITHDDYAEAIDKIEEIERETTRVFRAHLSPSTTAINERAVYDHIHKDLSNGLGGKAPKPYILNRIASYVDGATAERVLSSFIRRGLLEETQSKFGFVVSLPTKE